VAEWFETFFDEVWIRRADRAAEAEFLRRVLHLRAGDRLLDAPCGDAAVSIHLARRGMLVTGVDRLASAIAQARGAFAAQGLPGEFEVADLRALDFTGYFAAAFNWYGSFGYFSDDENADVLRRMARAVRPGGRVLVDQPNREWMLRGWIRHSRKGDLEIDSRWSPREQRAVSRWRLHGPTGVRECRSSIRIYTPAQFRSLFAAAGLVDVEVHGHWDGRPHGRRSPRTIVVGTRPRGRGETP
jgi:SAM-dependent methyltransferase